MKMDDFAGRSIRFVKGIGPARAEQFKRLYIYSVSDLLTYMPRDYEDRRELSDLSAIEFGKKQLFLLTLGDLSSAFTKSGRKRYSITAFDGGGSVELIWFHLPSYARARLRPGDRYLVYGKAELYRGGPQIIHPEIEEYDPSAMETTLSPLYGLTSGLTQRYLRGVIKRVLAEIKTDYDNMPETISAANGFMSFGEAVHNIHFPQSVADSQHARKRLAFDELAAFFNIINRKKAERELNRKTPYGDGSREDFSASLPFTLTDAQKRAMDDIDSDLVSGNMMYRLIQGDVASGKTVVAAYALFRAVKNGCQGAYMAPTGVLARQHYNRLSAYLSPMGVNVALLTGGMKKGARDEVLRSLQNGEVGILIGTHAMLYDDVRFSSLDMVVVDEQHKFGVTQRKTLHLKGKYPHYLIMSATPIPRTTMMLCFGDVDVSEIDQYPIGRAGAGTFIRRERDRGKIFDFIESEVMKGRRAYAVYPFIEDGNDDEIKSVKGMENIFRRRFGDDKVGILHGKMSYDEKQETIDAFISGRSPVLITTSVIEVGIDSREATVLLVEHPERFGLAQLHQLRGRVGRGEHRSYCILMASEGEIPERLEYFAKTDDGFKISEMDLSLRGGGEMMGVKQHGAWNMRVARPFEDNELFEAAKITASDPEAARSGYLSSVTEIYFPDIDPEVSD